VVSKGGNFLLNIGPSAHGMLDTAAYSRMKDIGDWMKINGSGIYGTRMFEVFGEANGVRYTRSKDKKTVHVFLPEFTTEVVTLDHMPWQKGMKAELLGSKYQVKLMERAGKTNVQLTKDAERDGLFTRVIKLRLP
jgi:alpha-L-fucosidase